jgi:hypothetical protein
VTPDNCGKPIQRCHAPGHRYPHQYDPEEYWECTEELVGIHYWCPYAQVRIYFVEEKGECVFDYGHGIEENGIEHNKRLEINWNGDTPLTEERLAKPAQENEDEETPHQQDKRQGSEEKPDPSITCEQPNRKQTDDDNCHGWIQCYKGKANQERCPWGKDYSSEKKQCMDAGFRDCPDKDGGNAKLVKKQRARIGATSAAREDPNSVTPIQDPQEGGQPHRLIGEDPNESFNYKCAEKFTNSLRTLDYDCHAYIFCLRGRRFLEDVPWTETGWVTRDDA